jgi:hypothetical protein
MALKDHSSCSWRLVANPDITPVWGNFRVAGNTPRTPSMCLITFNKPAFRYQSVDECIGDSARIEGL